jgi:hypothetical protein
MRSNQELRHRAVQLVARERGKFLPTAVRNFLVGVAAGLGLAATLIFITE